MKTFPYTSPFDPPSFLAPALCLRDPLLSALVGFGGLVLGVWGFWSLARPPPFVGVMGSC